LTTDADEKVDISGLPEYGNNQLRSQKTFSVQKDEGEVGKKAIGAGAAKQISGYVARFRERQKTQEKAKPAVALGGDDDDEP